MGLRATYICENYRQQSRSITAIMFYFLYQNGIEKNRHLCVIWTETFSRCVLCRKNVENILVPRRVTELSVSWWIVRVAFPASWTGKKICFFLLFSTLSRPTHLVWHTYVNTITPQHEILASEKSYLLVRASRDCECSELPNPS
jgi:hypothetical protein